MKIFFFFENNTKKKIKNKIKRTTILFIKRLRL